jgi:hypothetical protein
VIADRLVVAEHGDRRIRGADQLDGAGHLQQRRAVDQHKIEAGFGLGEQRTRCLESGRARH